MGKSQRDKGARRERELVQMFRDAGLPARRVPLSGATDYAKGDVEVLKLVISDELLEAQPLLWEKNRLLCELKARKNGEGFKQLETWKGDNDVLVLWRDRAKPQALIDVELLIKLLKGEV
jgi:hypothetical protein